MVGEIDFTITNVGPGFYHVPDSELLAVQAGDVLAVKEGTARLQLLKASESIYENYFDVDSQSMWTVRSVWGYSVTITASQKLDATHAVEAYVVRPVRMKFRHIYSEVTFVNRTVLITAFNNVTSALTSWTSVGVHVPIVNVSVEYPYVGKLLLFIYSSVIRAQAGDEISILHVYVLLGMQNINLLRK